jgi:hypothetical protein
MMLLQSNENVKSTEKKEEKNNEIERIIKQTQWWNNETSIKKIINYLKDTSVKKDKEILRSIEVGAKQISNENYKDDKKEIERLLRPLSEKNNQSQDEVGSTKIGTKKGENSQNPPPPNVSTKVIIENKNVIISSRDITEFLRKGINGQFNSNKILNNIEFMNAVANAVRTGNIDGLRKVLKDMGYSIDDEKFKDAANDFIKKIKDEEKKEEQKTQVKEIVWVNALWGINPLLDPYVKINVLEANNHLLYGVGGGNIFKLDYLALEIGANAFYNPVNEGVPGYLTFAFGTYNPLLMEDPARFEILIRGYLWFNKHSLTADKEKVSITTLNGEDKYRYPVSGIPILPVGELNVSYVPPVLSSLFMLYGQTTIYNDQSLGWRVGVGSNLSINKDLSIPWGVDIGNQNLVGIHVGLRGKSFNITVNLDKVGNNWGVNAGININFGK